MIACAAQVPRFDLPASGARPTSEAPPAPAVRTDGRSDGPSPRLLALHVTTGGRVLSLEGWCRQEVWTTLDGRAGLPFVRSESWSRLGQRTPRRLHQSTDAVFQGVMARLRPRPSGEVDFVIEISRGAVESDGPRFEWQGTTVKLPRPWQDGYRFEGFAPAGFVGVIARWGELEVTLGGPATKTPKAVHFRAGEQEGLVAGGQSALAEFYRLRWKPREPVERDYEGVLQARFEQERVREATGFRYDAANSRWIEFGAGFRVIADA